MKIGNPIKVDPRKLKKGDKLRVKKEVFPAMDPNNIAAPRIYCNTREECARIINRPANYIHSFADVGDIYTVTDFVPGIDPSQPKIFLDCSETGDDIGPRTAIKLINFGAFEYA
jgi:hypothetical protein